MCNDFECKKGSSCINEPICEINKCVLALCNKCYLCQYENVCRNKEHLVNEKVNTGKHN